jgi:hypothetical protein
MAWLCANCGVLTSRGTVTFDVKGDALYERCQQCAPEEFDTPFRDPTDNRIYTGPQAMPNRYKRDKNDVYQATDELIADTAALWDGGPTERAIRHKQATRRTEPMSAEEIAAARHWGEEVLAPAMRRGGIAAVVELLNK